jgi:hypothetical protein
MRHLGIERKERMKKSSLILVIFGFLLIALQLLRYAGNAHIGNELNFFSNVTNFETFVFELVYFLSYNFFGIVGLLLVITPWLCKKWDKRVKKKGKK